MTMPQQALERFRIMILTGSLDCPKQLLRTASELRAMDGHLWTAERDGIQCNRMKSAIEALSPDNETAVLDNLTRWETGTKLPDAIYEQFVRPILSLTSYLSKLTESIDKLTRHFPVTTQRPLPMLKHLQTI